MTHFRFPRVPLLFIAGCDGKTPAHACTIPLPALAELADARILLWEVEVPALDAFAFSQLVTDVSTWRAGEARERWLSFLQPLQDLCLALVRTGEVAKRKEVIRDARNRLSTLGIERVQGQRFLYSALNPIGEECFRECHFTIGEDVLQEVATDAAPWVDLWRDCYAFVAGRVAAQLRELLASAPSRSGAVDLPAFLQHCAGLNLPLTGAGLVVPAHLAFQEVKAAFREAFRDRADAAEWVMTPADCRLIREKLEYEPFDPYTFPSADLQLSARSAEAVARGEYQWILGELHPPPALLHHGGYWSCPDHDELSQYFAAATGGMPSLHYGFAAADFTAHTAVRYMDALPNLMTFVAPQRGDPRWRHIAPSEAEVFVDEVTNDVGVRERGTKRYLGSFARAWLIPLGFHPFFFGRHHRTCRAYGVACDRAKRGVDGRRE